MELLYGPIGVAKTISMRQKRRKIKQKCLIDQPYGTNQSEIEAKMSHRSDQTVSIGQSVLKFPLKPPCLRCFSRTLAVKSSKFPILSEIYNFLTYTKI